MQITREKWSKNFSEWFDWVLREGEFYDYGRYPVKGMGVWMSYGFKLRQNIISIIRNLLDSTGHEEVLFPLLIPEDLLRRESTHIKGFEEEVFWVTKGGSEDLDVKLALRPTSEVAITTMENLWLKSYKQLPKKYYQIVSVFRYETKATRPMIRLREITTFKEAHTVHETYDDAQRQVEEAIEIYKKIFDNLAIPYVLSERPEWDRFAGALHTYAFDTIMPDGKVMQIGTVHHLGQNFSRALDFKIQKKDGSLDYPHQTSYGISDRAIASVIAIHGDDHGPVLPPSVAPIKVVVVPIPAKNEEGTQQVMKYSIEICEMLNKNNITCVTDQDTEKTPGEKFYIWEIKGIPIRLEIGPRELASSTVFIKRRDNLKSYTVKKEEVVNKVKEVLNEIQEDLRKRAWEGLKSRIEYANDIEKAKNILENNSGIVEVPWCGSNECGLKIEELTNARVLGYPIEDRKVNDKCVICKMNAKTVLRVAKTY
ncbi:MAG: proline--tRNA ligase [Saccharolobus sp.]|uniref:Proline--tRNA ligase n=2 Tax=Saccharolobus shibatae TaxID=2286 RepID=A0A8F5C3F1_9CREN|nr:proline--tRNA ligase [Saccharolobus shibatae]MCH4814787.1 proline--tRNA ligase [Saccharolobus shibatae]QXJ29944.1 Prolyl-tRNA synthetase, archaeal/eukaryal type [Saccharolobus shibatae B12]QXJ33179.1 Prolyl-tRNA synthetase, archaeal/eukaryal type [Saccharolobus shibatae]QXJ36296.1 Prolyl-tRNA synthetase, archaeal/eukaryal type [Saccharolobus shibatae]